jgi:hypothetical protein
MKTATRSTPEYRYRGANARIIASQEPEVMLEGPAGTGKSVAILHKIHKCARKYPGMRALIVRQSRESLTQSTLVSFENNVLSPAWYQKIAAGCQRGYGRATPIRRAPRSWWAGSTSRPR